MRKSSLELPDTHQNYWQLAAIQLAGWTSLPILATSILILETNSFLGAVLTIIVGNALVWFIRLQMISLSREKRQSTLDISRFYLGSGGGYFVALLLLTSTLAWFIAQTTAASSSLTKLISFHEDSQIDKFAQVSVFLGILSAFLCMEGMVLLRRLTTICFPILLLAYIIIIFCLPDQTMPQNNNPLSLSGLTLVLVTNLGITSDLPTFFRHSKSWPESVKALTVIQLLTLALALSSLYFGKIIETSFEINNTIAHYSPLLQISLIVFIFLSVICANVANVYAASVGWEILAPKALVGRQEYLILGLGLTTIFILVSNLFSLEFLLNISDSSLVNLCLTLIIASIIMRVSHKPPAPLQQNTYFLAWLISTTVNILQYANVIALSYSTVALSLSIILVIVLVSLITV